MFNHEKCFKKHCFNMFMGEEAVNMKNVQYILQTCKNSKCSKSENFKKLSVLAQILRLKRWDVSYLG